MITAEKTTTNSTGVNTATYTNVCTHRLPCGYCPLMSRPCPMVCTITTPTWTTPISVPTYEKYEVTCQCKGAE